MNTAYPSSSIKTKIDRILQQSGRANQQQVIRKQSLIRTSSLSQSTSAYSSSSKKPSQDLSYHHHHHAATQSSLMQQRPRSISTSIVTPSASRSNSRNKVFSNISTPSSSLRNTYTGFPLNATVATTNTPKTPAAATTTTTTTTTTSQSLLNNNFFPSQNATATTTSKPHTNNNNNNNNNNKNSSEHLNPLQFSTEIISIKGKQSTTPATVPEQQRRKLSITTSSSNTHPSHPVAPLQSFSQSTRFDRSIPEKHKSNSTTASTSVATATTTTTTTNSHQFIPSMRQGKSLPDHTFAYEKSNTNQIQTRKSTHHNNSHTQTQNHHQNSSKQSRTRTTASPNSSTTPTTATATATATLIMPNTATTTNNTTAGTTTTTTTTAIAAITSTATPVATESDSRKQLNLSPENIELRELQTKYHLRDALLRQEIHRLEQENSLLKLNNQQLLIQIERSLHSQATESETIRKLERQFTENKNSLFDQFNSWEKSIVMPSSALCRQCLNYSPLIAQQDQLIKKLKHQLEACQFEKEHVEKILKNILLKNEQRHQQQQQQQQAHNIQNTQQQQQQQQQQQSQQHQSKRTNYTVQQQLNLLRGQDMSFELSSLQSSRVNAASPLIPLSSTLIPSLNLVTSPGELLTMTTTKRPPLSGYRFFEDQENILPSSVTAGLKLTPVKAAGSASVIQNTDEQLTKNNNYNTEQKTDKKLKESSSLVNSIAGTPAKMSGFKANELFDMSANSGSKHGGGFIFGPPQSVSVCSQEEDLKSKNFKNSRVQFLDSNPGSKAPSAVKDMGIDLESSISKSDTKTPTKHRQVTLSENNTAQQSSDPYTQEFVVNHEHLQSLIQEYKAKHLNQKRI